MNSCFCEFDYMIRYDWSQYLLHFSVKSLTHLRPAMSDQD